MQLELPGKNCWEGYGNHSWVFLLIAPRLIVLVVSMIHKIYRYLTMCWSSDILLIAKIIDRIYLTGFLAGTYSAVKLKHKSNVSTIYCYALLFKHPLSIGPMLDRTHSSVMGFCHTRQRSPPFSYLSIMSFTKTSLSVFVYRLQTNLVFLINIIRILVIKAKNNSAESTQAR